MLQEKFTKAKELNEKIELIKSALQLLNNRDEHDTVVLCVKNRWGDYSYPILDDQRLIKELYHKELVNQLEQLKKEFESL